MHRTRTFVSAALVLAAVTLLGCSKDDNKNPTGSTSRLFDSGNLGNGAVFSQTFPNAGNFPYHCAIHSFMTGSVVVDAGAPAGDQTVSITGSAFVNATVTIRPGAKVTWTNNDGIAHTVTSNS